MEILYHIPQSYLADYIQHMVYVNGSVSAPYINELPQGGINLVIELNENTTNHVYSNGVNKESKPIKKAWITGFQKQPLIYKNNPNSCIISIRFKPGGFYALTKIPIDYIPFSGIEAVEILGEDFYTCYQKILNSQLITEKLKVLENYFLQKEVETSIEQQVIEFASLHSNKTMDWIIRKTGYSQKHFIHIHKKHTGFTPKFFQRIKRLHRLLNDLHTVKGQVDWFALVQRYGYVDQAHLIKEFKAITGLTPTEYLNSMAALERNKEVPDMILNPPKS